MWQHLLYLCFFMMCLYSSSSSIAVVANHLRRHVEQQNVYEYYRLEYETDTRSIYAPLTKRSWVSWIWRMELFLDHHIKTFLRRFAQNHLTHIDNYRLYNDRYDQIIPGVFLGSIPLHQSLLYDLTVNSNVTHVVNMLGSDEYEELPQMYEHYALNELRAETPDHEAPRVEDLQAIVEFTRNNLAWQASTFFHCFSGRTRSGYAVLAVLIDQFQNQSAHELNQMLVERRSIVKPWLHSTSLIQEFVRVHRQL